MAKIFNRDVEVAGNVTVTGTGAFKDENGAEAVPQIRANGTVSAQAATATLTTAIAGKILTNTGASGTIVLTLPSAASMKGKTFQVKTTVAQIISLSPESTDAIYLAGSGVDNKDLSITGVIGNTVTIYSNGSDYEAYYPNGVVTKEA